MTLLVDTSVWSLALRRDKTPASPEVGALRAALESGEIVLTTGLILQDLLQGFSGPRTREQLIALLCLGQDLTLLSANRDFEHIAALRALRPWKGS